MTWQKVIVYVLGGVALIVLGYLLHSAFTPKPTTEVREVVVRDTIETLKTITVTKRDTITRTIRETGIAYVDSIAGSKDEVDYKIIHSITDIGEVLSDWQVEVKPLTKTIVEYVTKDSIRTVVDTRYIQAPFFVNTYFYTTIAMVIITVLAIIF